MGEEAVVVVEVEEDEEEAAGNTTRTNTVEADVAAVVVAEEAAINTMPPIMGNELLLEEGLMRICNRHSNASTESLIQNIMISIRPPIEVGSTATQDSPSL